MRNSSYIEISKNALKSNLTFLRSLIGTECKLSSVIKGNAYGHGIEIFVPLAEKLKVDHFSVFSVSEALRIKKVSNGNSSVLVMGLIEKDEIEWAILNKVDFYVFDFNRLTTTIKIATKLKKKARIHIEVETGMNRTGFNPKELPELAEILIKNTKHIELEGICSHFAGAESITNYLRIKTQSINFKKTLKWFEKKEINFKKKHLACSAAMINYPKSMMDLVRVGIMQYGFWSSKETLMNYLSKKSDKTDPLKRIISWKSRIMCIKEVETGEFIGYGTSFMAEYNMKIAIIPVGYSEGYNRTLSNQGRVLIRGHRVNVIGAVNMNMLIADISFVDGAENGDEVVLIGEQNNMNVSVASFGELSNLLNYELLTRLPLDIPRIVTK